MNMLKKFEVKRPSQRTYELMRIEMKNFIGSNKGDPWHDYDLLEEVGKGGYGRVYKAISKSCDAVRAIKVIEKKGMKTE